MVTCTHCQKSNTLDSAFCRGCGHTLDANQVAEARTANQALLADGFKFLSEQRFDEALMVAQTVNEHDPSLPQAYSLRADALERKGQLLEAIVAYEKALEFRPDSTLDRIKLTHLKNVMAERTATAPKPNKRTAILASLAAMTLFGSLGTAAALWQQSSQPREGTLVAQNSPGQPGNFTPSLPTVPAPTASKPEPKPAPVTAQARPEETEATNVARPSGAAPLPEATGRPTQPRPTPGIAGEVAPMRPPMNLEPIPQPNTQSKPPTQDPDPEPATAASTAQQPATTTATTNSNQSKPVIDIRPAPNSGRVNGSEPRPDGAPQTSADWSRKGRELYLQRDFNGAANAYERALALGADAAITNQRLAQSLEQAGKRAAAVEAYDRAAAAYQRRIDRGSGSEADRNALAACQQAAAALRG